MGVTLTKSSIDKAVARAADGARVELVDDQEPGLRIRAGDRGAKWSVLARMPNGDRIRVPLGTWPNVGIKDARKLARDEKQKIERGINPNLERQNARDHSTVGELLDLYDKTKLRGLRTGDETRKALDRALKPLLDRDPLLLTRRDISRIVDTKAQTAPVGANRWLAYMRAFFGWAVGRGHMVINPAADLSKPTNEIARDHCPTLDEVAEIWQAAEGLGYPFGPIVKLLICTASRREEVAAIRVAELDLEGNGAGPTWTVPAARSKNGRAIRVPLAPAAVTLLTDALKKRPKDAPLVFTGTGTTPVSGWSKAKSRLDALIVANRAQKAAEAGEEPMPLRPWRLHDLRRSFATVACDVLHVDPAIADRCLNHVGAATTSTVARVYGRSEMFDQRKSALLAWVQLVETTAKPDEEAEAGVIELLQVGRRI